MTYILRKHEVCQIGIHPHNIPSGIALCKGSFINHENMAGEGAGYAKCHYIYLLSTKGEAEQKCPKNCPHGLWMTSNNAMCDQRYEFIIRLSPFLSSKQFLGYCNFK